jgi:hypothetical protein
MLTWSPSIWPTVVNYYLFIDEKCAGSSGTPDAMGPQRPPTVLTVVSAYEAPCIYLVLPVSVFARK